MTRSNGKFITVLRKKDDVIGRLVSCTIGRLFTWHSNNGFSMILWAARAVFPAVYRAFSAASPYCCPYLYDRLYELREENYQLSYIVLIVYVSWR